MTDTNTSAQGLRVHAGVGPIRLLPAENRISVRNGLAVEKNLDLAGEANGRDGAGGDPESGGAARHAETARPRVGKKGGANG